MGWKITVQLDEARRDVGTLTGTWTEDDGSEFTFSARSLVDEESTAEFMKTACDARDARLEKSVTERGIADVITDKVNKADPKAIAQIQRTGG
jgi:hypothetical protein